MMLTSFLLGSALAAAPSPNVPSDDWTVHARKVYTSTGWSTRTLSSS